MDTIKVILAGLFLGVLSVLSYDIHRTATAICEPIVVRKLGVEKPEKGESFLPDPKKTPGVALPGVTAEQLCVRGYATKTRGSLSEKVKKEVCRRYGLTYPLPHGKYEYDHLVSIELGGDPDSPDNIWPQRYDGLWNAHLKDKLENELHRLVCNKEITLDEAQLVVKTDWVVDGYEKYISN